MSVYIFSIHFPFAYKKSTSQILNAVAKTRVTASNVQKSLHSCRMIDYQFYQPLSFLLPCLLPYVTVRCHVRVEVGDVAECLVTHRALERGR